MQGEGRKPDSVGVVLGRVWRFLRNSVLVVLALSLLGGAVAAGFHFWHEWQASKVTLVFEHKGRCEDPEFPLFVEFENRAWRPVHHVSFRVNARRPGHSTDLVGYEGYYSSDRIIPVGSAASICWRYPPLRGERDTLAPVLGGRTPEKVDKSKLEWSVKLGSVRFGE